MYQRKIPESFDCGISVFFKIVGGKWKAWIIECLESGKKRPSELHREINAASPRVINMHLKELEEYGIIAKNVYMEIPMRVEYYLTDVGRSLLPVINVMEKWGKEKRNEVNLSQSF
jgi:DNA-binding HxlR family transcriptional regulator